MLPSVIKRLDEDVINRIAAGEVIQRPANALKELLENSLDAKSTNINVTLRDGGLKLLLIQDNGTGIRKEDLDIVCERFTTSKLSQFEDLGGISTFGFRGEALASISHVAHLTITTKTADDICGYKASYSDGKLKAPPKACAGNQGTQITVEDLFYNIPTRKKAFKSSAGEHSKVADVVARYAVHNPSVGFCLKKQGENLPELKTNSNSSCIENIRCIFGNNIARELINVEACDEILKFKLSGYISNVNYSTKKQVFILFINNRLVDSAALRKSIENVYSLYLPKGSYPFMYLSIDLDPHNVDVNVHPTKHEVHFLHEDAVIDTVKQAVESKLLGSNTSRVFYTQAKLPVLDLDLKSAVLEKTLPEKAAPKNMVRTDSSEQKLDKFLNKQDTDSNTSCVSSVTRTANTNSRREIKLTSILNLRMKIEDECNLALRDIICNLTYVGSIDTHHSLIQHNTSLYMSKTGKLMEELFYQILLYDFGNLGVIKFKEGLPLYDIAIMGLDDPASCWKEENGSKEELATMVGDLLFSKAAMLQDYFSIEIDDKKTLWSIPLILENYSPDISHLPSYILRLACDVDWETEKPCFQGICRETARFYSNVSVTDSTEWQWTMEHIIYPAIKKILLPPKAFAQDETLLQIAHLPDLYKVFERC